MKNSNEKGFTLVEIMIVVVIIGLLATMAIPAFKKVRENSNARIMTNDFKQFAGALNLYNLKNGAWPADAAASVIPSGMEGLMPSEYAEGSSLGGGFVWDGDTALLSLSNSEANDIIMERVDEVLDDGDLNTGVFQKSGTSYQYDLDTSL